MAHWLETPKGHFKMVNGVPTGEAHNATYHEAHGHVVKITHNPDGTSAAEIFPPRKIAFVDDVTGDIKALDVGFSLTRELDGVTASKVNGATAIELGANDIPAGFNVNTHKWDKKQKKIVAK